MTDATPTAAGGYAEISRCNRCGFCQSVCPTYAQSKDETQVARGRIHLLRLLISGRYDWTRDPGLAEKVNDCLLCGACTAGCPATVETAGLMRTARRDFLKIKGLSLFYRLVYRGGLSRRERQERVSLLLRLYEKSGARNLLYRETLRKAWERLAYLNSFLPAGLEAPVRRDLPPVLRPAGKPRLKVAFFLGCASNVFGGRAVRSILGYLAGRGVEIHLPPVSCCGEPHRSAGDEAEAARLARANTPLLFGGDYDFIVSECSTCAHSLAHYDLLAGPDSREATVIRPRLSRVVEVNTLVRDHLGLDRAALTALPETRVTYHDSCHAVRGLGVREAPRDILKAIPGVELAEMAEADGCCGGAGSYSFSHPDMSGRIAAAKAAHIRATEADTLAVSCPGCALQLGAALRRADAPVTVVHPVELLARALEAPI
jgi:glycolate oxidase iron-sulfur subunit